MQHFEQGIVCPDKYFVGHSKEIVSLTFGPNDNQLATGSVDNIVKIWKIGERIRSYILRGHIGTVKAVSYAPNGHDVASCSSDMTVKIWSSSLKQTPISFPAHTSCVNDISYSQSQCLSLLVSCGNDKVIKFWSTKGQKFVSSLTGHKNWVRSVRFLPLDSLLISGSDDKSVCLWNYEVKRCIHRFADLQCRAVKVASHPFGNYFAGCGQCLTEKNICIWDHRLNCIVQKFTDRSESINWIAFHPSGNYLASAQDSTISIYDLVAGKHLLNLNGFNSASVKAVEFSHSGKLMASADNHGNVLLWNSFL